MIRQGEITKSSRDHIPIDVQQTKETKAEIENKVAKILKLIKSKDQRRKGGPPKDSKKESELIGLVEDFHTQYQSLYALYDHLRGELGRKALARKEKENFPSSPSSSDSEYYSSEEIGSSNNHSLHGGHEKEAASAKEETEIVNQEVADLKHKLASTTREKEALNSEYIAALSTIQEAEITNNNLRKEANERERELSALVKEHEVRGRQSLARVKELEGQITGLKTELESLSRHKANLESRIKSKTTEFKQLVDKNKGLHSRIVELELISKEKRDEIAALLKQLKDNENNQTSKIEGLSALVRKLQLEMDSLQAQKGELEGTLSCDREGSSAQTKRLIDHVNNLEHELESLQSQKRELELQLERKAKEFTDNQVQVENLKGELAGKTTVERQMLKEKQGLMAQIEELKSGLNNVHNRIKELEGQISSKINETNQLREEKKGLQARILKLERTLTGIGNELSSQQKRLEGTENEASMQIMTLKLQSEKLQQELDSLQAEKTQLELQMDSEKQESLKNLSQLEDQNSKLKTTVADQEKILKGMEYKHIRCASPRSRINLNIAERKMEELAGEFRKNLEDNIRILNQRILVAEQIQAENKDCFRRIKQGLKQGDGGLEEKVAIYEAEFRKMRETLAHLTRMDLAFRKLEETGNLMDRISKISNEVLLAKDWVRSRKDERKQMQLNMESLVVQIDDKEEQELLLREKVWKLEAKLGKEGGEKLNLINSVSQLEKRVKELEKKIKEKDEGLLGLAEEKREAIRQLCILIDYQRSRCNHYKKLMAKMPLKDRILA